MKIIFALFLPFCFFGLRGQDGQDSLKNLQRLAGLVEKSEIIFEGRVVSQRCFFNRDSGWIFTSNLFVPDRWFKGDLMDTVEIITIGGTLGNKFFRLEDAGTAGFGMDLDYFVFCKKKNWSYYNIPNVSYYPVDPEIGYIGINTDITGYNQDFSGKIYNDLRTELYNPVAILVGQEYKVLGKNRREIAFEKQYQKQLVQHDWRDSLRRRDSLAHVDQLLVKHLQLRKLDNGTKALAFDITITAVLDKHDKITAYFLYLNYDTSRLGTGIIGKKLFTVVLDQKISPYYSLSLSDIAGGMIKMTITALPTQMPPPVTIEKNDLILTHCLLQVNDTTRTMTPLMQFNIPLSTTGSNTFYDSRIQQSRAFSVVLSGSPGVNFPVRTNYSTEMPH